MTSIIVRRMEVDDIEGYNACLDVVAREGKFLAHNMAPSVEVSREWVVPHIQAGHAFYVAVDPVEQLIVGWCDVTPREYECFSHCGDLGMGVLPTFRGKGIGVRLLTAALDHARQPLERVGLEVFASNNAALQLYEGAGFVREGVFVKGRKYRGAYEDVIYMAMLF
ncbi:MAG: GNAT family protein [Gammaproteobacteria bacterium]